MKESEKKYKKIDPWKLISDAPLTILGSIALVITWPIRYFRDSKDTKLNKKNPKLRIMYSLISITDEYENLSDRELKVACSIFSTPWFQNERSKTILDLQSKIILNSFEENTKILVKYLEPLDDETIFYLRLYCSKKLYGDDAGEIIRDYDDITDFKKRGAEERKSYIEAIIKVHHNTLKGQKIKINNLIFYLGKLNLLQLELIKNRSSRDRKLFYITGGVLTKRKNLGWLEFRSILNNDYIIIAIHEYIPKLPWLIYKNSQAKLHLYVMKKFEKEITKKI